jgi:peptidyl-prolyl cis-trans isomerase C
MPEEEVLYREAMVLGLDKDDAIIKRRLARKMGFLAEDVAAAREPTAVELNALDRTSLSRRTVVGLYWRLI